MCDTAYFALVEVSLIGFFAPALLSTAVNYFVYDLSKESYILVTPAMLPYDWQTPIGYLIATVTNAFAVFYTTLLDTSVVAFLIGSVRLFIEFNVIYEFLIFGYITWTLICMSSSLLVIQTLLSDNVSDAMELGTPLTELAWAFSLIIFFCEFGQMVCEVFEIFDDQLCQCDWYLFPIEMQRIYLTFSINTQRPTVVRGFGNILCTRETFKKTTNTAFSYFMTLRSMSA